MDKPLSVEIPRMGLGCMNVSHAYGPALPEDRAIDLLQSAYSLGYRHFDTATLYGFGGNETLVGKALKDRRSDIFLASKCGMAGVDGKKTIDGRPETIRAQVEASLERLQTDHIDLYYLHRVDKSVPVEESLGALLDAKERGLIGAIGLSEVSTETLTRAVAAAPIAAVQNEYSIWSRNCELGVSDFCANNGIVLVAFSPVCRGFLGIDWPSFEGFADGDIRRGMPRFQPSAVSQNQSMAAKLDDLAKTVGVSRSQLALMWVLAQGEHIVAIPGTRSLQHLKDNFACYPHRLSAEIIAEISAIYAPSEVAGNRYPEGTQAEIDTERFPFELANAAI